MPTYILKKLVRDNIPQNQQETGQNPVFHKLSAGEHAKALLEKLIEEAKEIPLHDKAEATKELADVRQAMEDLAELLGIADHEVRSAQTAKNQRNGAFKEGYFVETVTVEADSDWDQYYGNEPDRFAKIDD